MEFSDEDGDEDEDASEDVDFMIYRVNTFEDPDQVIR